MRIDRRAIARTFRTLLGLADRLHPAALLVLVGLLVGLVYLSAPLVVTMVCALVAAIKAAAFLGGAAVLARVAIRAASTYRNTPPPAVTP
ncbi:MULTISPECIES: hypothetical protein [Streptacidiphilus]|uniref:Uncharacterized protein n=1 Tax=Streptacidiphilus cavernicola TaxID=3342716 RepID=A0ABV6UWJ6_9ACTN|nr:hypothetical protein [Streptacidiphilus jeojiense]